MLAVALIPIVDCRSAGRKFFDPPFLRERGMSELFPNLPQLCLPLLLAVPIRDVEQYQLIRLHALGQSGNVRGSRCSDWPESTAASSALSRPGIPKTR